MNDNTEKLPDDLTGELATPPVSDEDANSIRGGEVGVSQVLSLLGQAADGVVRAIGDGLATSARKG